MPSLGMTLLHDAAEEDTFVLLVADASGDKPRLTARCLNARGKVLFEMTLGPGDLGL